MLKTSEVKKSALFKGILAPSKIKLEAHKIDETLWEMKYTEWFSAEDKALLDEAISTTRALLVSLGVRYKRRGNSVTITQKGPVEKVFASLLGELLLLSKLGQLTLSDLLLLAGIGSHSKT